MYRKGYPLWAVLLSSAVVFLLFYLPHRFWYWDLLPDKLVHRRYFRRTVFPLAEIVYIGPMTGPASGNGHVKNWILIRNAAEERMIATPADPDAFLEAARQYLPAITLQL